MAVSTPTHTPAAVAALTLIVITVLSTQTSDAASVVVSSTPYIQSGVALTNAAEDSYLIVDISILPKLDAPATDLTVTLTDYTIGVADATYTNGISIVGLPDAATAALYPPLLLTVERPTFLTKGILLLKRYLPPNSRVLVNNAVSTSIAKATFIQFDALWLESSELRIVDFQCFTFESTPLPGMLTGCIQFSNALTMRSGSVVAVTGLNATLGGHGSGIIITSIDADASELSITDNRYTAPATLSYMSALVHLYDITATLTLSNGAVFNVSNNDMYSDQTQEGRGGILCSDFYWMYINNARWNVENNRVVTPQSTAWAVYIYVEGPGAITNTAISIRNNTAGVKFEIDEISMSGSSVTVTDNVVSSISTLFSFSVRPPRTMSTSVYNISGNAVTCPGWCAFSMVNLQGVAIVDSSILFSHNLLNVTQYSSHYVIMPLFSSALLLWVKYASAHNLQLDVSYNTFLVLGDRFAFAVVLEVNTLQDSTLSIANNSMTCGPGMLFAGFLVEYTLPSITNSLVELRGNTVKESKVAISVTLLAFEGKSRTSLVITGNSAHSTTYQQMETFGLIHLNANTPTLFHDGSVLDVSENTYTFANAPSEPITGIAILSTCIKPLLSQQSHFTVNKNTVTVTGNVASGYNNGLISVERCPGLQTFIGVGVMNFERKFAPSSVTELGDAIDFRGIWDATYNSEVCAVPPVGGGALLTSAPVMSNLPVGALNWGVILLDRSTMEMSDNNVTMRGDVSDNGGGGYLHGLVLPLSLFASYGSSLTSQRNTITVDLSFMASPPYGGHSAGIMTPTASWVGNGSTFAIINNDITISTPFGAYGIESSRSGVSDGPPLILGPFLTLARRMAARSVSDASSLDYPTFNEWSGWESTSTATHYTCGCYSSYTINHNAITVSGVRGSVGVAIQPYSASAAIGGTYSISNNVISPVTTFPMTPDSGSTWFAAGIIFGGSEEDPSGQIYSTIKGLTNGAAIAIQSNTITLQGFAAFAGVELGVRVQGNMWIRNGSAITITSNAISLSNFANSAAAPPKVVSYGVLLQDDPLPPSIGSPVALGRHYKTATSADNNTLCNMGGYFFLAEGSTATISHNTIRGSIDTDRSDGGQRTHITFKTENGASISGGSIVSIHDNTLFSDGGSSVEGISITGSIYQCMNGTVTITRNTITSVPSNAVVEDYVSYAAIYVRIRNGALAYSSTFEVSHNRITFSAQGVGATSGVEPSDGIIVVHEDIELCYGSHYVVDSNVAVLGDVSWGQTGVHAAVLLTGAEAFDGSTVSIANNDVSMGCFDCVGVGLVASTNLVTIGLSSNKVTRRMFANEVAVMTAPYIAHNHDYRCAGLVCVEYTSAMSIPAMGMPSMADMTAPPFVIVEVAARTLQPQVSSTPLPSLLPNTVTVAGNVIANNNHFNLSAPIVAVSGNAGLLSISGNTIDSPGAGNIHQGIFVSLLEDHADSVVQIGGNRITMGGSGQAIGISAPRSLGYSNNNTATLYVRSSSILVQSNIIQQGCGADPFQCTAVHFDGSGANVSFTNRATFNITGNRISLHNASNETVMLVVAQTSFNQSSFSLERNEFTFDGASGTIAALSQQTSIPARYESDGNWYGAYDTVSEPFLRAECNRFQGAAITSYATSLFMGVTFDEVILCHTHIDTLATPPNTTTPLNTTNTATTAAPPAKSPAANAESRALTTASQPPAVLFICAAGTPIEVQAMIWLYESDCGTPEDHASVDIARYFVSPFASLEDPGAAALGNVGIAAVVGIIHVASVFILSKVMVQPNEDVGVEAPDDRAPPSVLSTAASLLFPGATMLISRVAYLGATTYGLVAFRRGGTGLSMAGGVISLLFGVAVPAAHAFCIVTSGKKGRYVAYDWEQAGVPAWRRWLYPGGRWCGAEVRRKFAWVVTPYQGGWRRWATMTPMSASFVLIAIPLGAVGPSAGCTGLFIVPSVGFLLIALFYFITRPRRSLVQSLLTGLCYGLVGIVGISQATSRDTTNTSDFKAASSFLLMIVAMIRGVHSIVVLIIECLWEGKHPSEDATNPTTSADGDREYGSIDMVEKAVSVVSESNHGIQADMRSVGFDEQDGIIILHSSPNSRQVSRTVSGASVARASSYLVDFPHRVEAE